MSVKLLVEIIGDASKLASELDKASGQAGGFASSLAGVAGTAAKVAGAASAVAVVGAAIVKTTQAAGEDEAQQKKLETAYRNTGAATGDYTTSIQAAIDAGQDAAFADSEVRDALIPLVTATGDAKEANDLLAVAFDVSRAAGVPLAQAADAVAKASVGQDTALRRLLPGLAEQETSTDTIAEAQRIAAGASDDYATSLEGMGKKGTDAFGELSEVIGGAFLPVFEAILPALVPLLESFGQLVTAILPLLVPLLQSTADVLVFVADGLTTVVGWVTKLVDWLRQAIDWVGRFLDKLDDIGPNISLPSLPGIGNLAVAGPAGATTRGAGTGGGPVTVNVYTTGDSIAAEKAVLAALRRVTRLNGGRLPL